MAEQENPTPIADELPYVVVDEEPNWYWRAFDEGLQEGLFAFGAAFPFLLVSLLSWFGTVMLVPIVVRKARKIGSEVIESGRDLIKPDAKAAEDENP